MREKNIEPQQSHSGHDTPNPVESDLDMVSLTNRDEQYIGITIDTVRVNKMAEYTTLLGTTNFDERKVTIITSRIRGRLDKLFVRSPQQVVTAGQPMYAIYSEELLSYENEFLNALEQQSQFGNMERVMNLLVEAARNKLFLWGLSADQIAQLEKDKKTSPLVTYYSTISATLVDLAVSEGQYVETGTPLFRLADLSYLWIETQMYPDELRWLFEKPIITAEFDSYPDETYQVVPVFDNPLVEGNQKISLVRFLIINRNEKLKPGMMAYINIKRNEKKTIVIPKSSILMGNMITAWIKTGEGTYESRMIELGIQNKKEVEVINGLNAGELIVTRGSYLLNSALILKKGAGMPGMEGMKM